MEPNSFSPSVDIIIITYNQEKFINDTIASAINQLYPNIKIIIADDCSDDNTREIIDKWHLAYPDKIIKVYNNCHLGITGNSNAGLKKSNGDYFIIIGGDDIMYENRVKEQINWFRENKNAVLCGHELDYINADGHTFFKYKYIKRQGKGNIDWIKYGMIYGTISIMYKKNKMNKLEYDKRLYYVSDLKFCIDFLKDNKEYGFLDMPLSGYRKTEKSITISKWAECLNDCNSMFDILRKEYGTKLNFSIFKGHNYLINYSTGIVYFKKGQYLKSLLKFLKVIKIDFTQWKAIVRIIQVSYRIFILKLSKPLVFKK